MLQDRRQGAFSVPIKMVMFIVASVIVLVIVIMAQQGLLERITDPIDRFIATVLGGI